MWGPLGGGQWASPLNVDGQSPGARGSGSGRGDDGDGGDPEFAGRRFRHAAAPAGCSGGDAADDDGGEAPVYIPSSENGPLFCSVLRREREREM